MHAHQRIIPFTLALAATPAAVADFIGIQYTSRPGYSDPGLTVYDFYAVFDDPDDDLAFVHGLDAAPMSIQATSGAYYHATSGADGPSPESIWNASQAVQDDSFVTIGVPFVPSGANDFLALPGWDPVSTTFNSTGLVWGNDSHGTWVNADPDNGWGSAGSWGRAGNYADNAVLFAQLTVASGGIDATNVTIAYLDGDWDGEGVLTHVTTSFSVGNACPADLNSDGTVDVLDLLNMLTAWGPNAGNPADLNGDGTVDVLDLLSMLSVWGAC